MIEIKRTHSNIFNWLKPTKQPFDIVTSTREQVQHEEAERGMAEVEPIEVVDRDREERVDRVKKRQLQWPTSQLCKGFVLELVIDMVTRARHRICEKVLVEDVMDRSGAR